MAGTNDAGGVLGSRTARMLLGSLGEQGVHRNAGGLLIDGCGETPSGYQFTDVVVPISHEVGGVGPVV